MKILIAEDESDLRVLLHDQLSGAGHEVIEAENGIRALQLFQSEAPDMAVLDVMMPVMDGFSLLAQIRETSDMPVIFLTGLRLGADDYLVKPWGRSELLARIEVQKRHIKKSDNVESVLVSGNLWMDFGNGVIKKENEVLNLNAKEYHILKFFAENKGKVLTKKQIYQEVWQDEFVYDDNTIMVHISHLRSKIDDDSHHHIETLIGIGYRFS